MTAHVKLPILASTSSDDEDIFHAIKATLADQLSLAADTPMETGVELKKPWCSSPKIPQSF
jgi:hypothetical protein